MTTYRLFNIEYDTDNNKIVLPNEIIVTEEKDWDIDLEGADKISDITGWCVISFEYEIL